MSSSNRTLAMAFVLAMIPSIQGCGSGDTPLMDAGPQLPEGTSLFIQISDTADRPIPLAAVSVAGEVRAADNAGRVLLEDIAPGRVAIRVSAPGHAPASVVTEVPEGAHAGVEARLHPLGPPMPFDAAQGAQLEQGPVRVEIPANQLVDRNGEPVTGMVEATVVPLDPASVSPADLPGPLDGAMREDGTEANLESVAMVEVSLWQDGLPVQLAAGARATVEMVLSELQASQVTVGERIPAWWLDEATGIWREDGEGVIQIASSDPGKLAWVAEVGHFTWWNADKPWTDKNCFDVTVVDENGNPVANVVVGAEGVDYTGSSWLIATEADGTACMDIKLGGTADIIVGSWGSPLVAATQVTGTGPASACSGEGAACVPVTITVPPVLVCAPGESQACAYSGPAGTEGVGICQAGTNYCNVTGTGWSGCTGEVLPQTETCASLFDDDCDGLVNADDSDAVDCGCSAGETVSCYGGPAGTEGVGMCQAGVRTCDANTGLFGACVGEVLPQPETCATPGDDDCNGSTDCTGLWSRGFDTAYPGVGTTHTVAVDAADNIVVAGHFGQFLDLGNGPLPGPGYVAKFDAAGNTIWSLSHPILFALPEWRLHGLAIDSVGDIVITGFNTIVKLGTNGNELWGRNFGVSGSPFHDTVAVDGAGNIVVAGSHVEPVDFGGGPLGGLGDPDVCVAQLGPDGTHLWSRRFAFAGEQQVLAAAVDSSGNILIAGFFDGSVDFGGGELFSAGGNDIFLVKLDGGGNHLWSWRAGDSANQVFRFHPELSFAWSIGFDATDSPVIAGYFFGAVSFGGPFLISSAEDDMFVVKLDPAGNHVWSRQFGVGGFQRAHGIAVDANGAVLLAGGFENAVDMGGGYLDSAGGTDILVARLDPAGNHVWSRRFGDSDWQYASGIALDSVGNPVIIGFSRGILDLGNGPLSTQWTESIFLGKLEP